MLGCQVAPPSVLKCPCPLSESSSNRFDGLVGLIEIVDSAWLPVMLVMLMLEPTVKEVSSERVSSCSMSCSIPRSPLVGRRRGRSRDFCAPLPRGADESRRNAIPPWGRTVEKHGVTLR